MTQKVTTYYLTDKNKILYETLRYNEGVLTKNTVQPRDLQSVQDKNELHETVMNYTECMHNAQRATKWKNI